MEATQRPPRYMTLRDYVRVLRRYRVAILILAAVGAAAGFADAKRQQPVYQSVASVSFQDPEQDLTLVGLGGGLIQPPATLAAQNAETIGRPQVIAAVQQRLKTPIGRYGGGLSAQVSNAGLLQIAGSSTDPRFSAELANAGAQVVVSQSNKTTRQTFAAAAADIGRQIASLRPPTNPGKSTELSVYGEELARLATLARFAKSAQLEQPATESSAPVSPNTTRSTLIGLALGLVLGIAVAFIRDAMDRRLRTAGEVEEAYALPVVGHVRSQLMGKVAGVGASRDREHQLDLEAFRILRRNVEFLSSDSPPKSILVTSGVPAEGKTTVAASLACTLATAGRNVLLVEGDLRRPVLSDRLGIEAAPGLSDYLLGRAKPPEILRVVELGDAPSANGSQPVALSDTADSLVCIPAGTPTSRAAELLGSSRFTEFLQQVSQAYDAVVIDTSPLLPLADTLEILPHVDSVVLCARAQKTTRDEAHAVKAALGRLAERPMGIVVTDIKPGQSDYQAYSYSYSYG